MSRKRTQQKRKRAEKRAIRLKSAAVADRLYLRSMIGDVIVDRESGIIRNAAIITLGAAKGHPFAIDRSALSQVYDVIQKRGGTLPVRCTHPDDGQDGLPSTVGVVRNVTLAASSVRGDVHLLKNAPGREHLLDVAESMPTEIGLSLEFPADGFSIEDESGNIVLRVTRVDAADLVGRPAANPNGLLAAGDTPMADENKNDEGAPKESGGSGVKLSPEAVAMMRKRLGIPDDIPDEEIETYLKVKEAEDKQVEKETEEAPTEPGAGTEPPMKVTPVPVLSAKTTGKAMTLAQAAVEYEAINEIASAMNLSRDWADAQIKAGADRKEAGLAAIEARKKLDARHTPTGGGSSSMISNKLVLEAAVAQTLRLSGAEKQFGDQTMQKAHTRFRGRLGLQELIMECARAGGWTGRDLIRDDHSGALRLAFSTGDLSSILSNVANKFLLEGFNEVESTWRMITKVTPVKDFKQITSYRLTVGEQYQEVPPGGKIPHGTLGSESFTNQARKYAMMLSIPWEDQVNDDLGSLSAVPTRLGRLSALKINDVFWTAFLDNASFWTTSNGTRQTGAGSVFGITGLTNAEILFDAIRDNDGDSQNSGLGNLILHKPSLLVVPTALDNSARVMMSSAEIRDTTASTKFPVNNPHAGKYTIAKSAYLQADSATRWYLLAAPATLPVVETVFLFGNESPTVESADADFSTLGIEMRGYHAFGVNKQDYRGGVCSDGA